MAKVHRKVVRKTKSGLSTGMVLIILGVALVVVVGIIAAMTWPKPQAAGARVMAQMLDWPEDLF